MLERFPRPASSEPSQRWHAAVPTPPMDKFLKLPKQERRELIANTAQEFIDALKAAGGREFSDMNVLYGKLKGKRLIVRRGSPERVIEAVANRLPISIAFAGDTPYNNAVEWHSDLGPVGLSNAYLEGNEHKNSIVAVFGFHPKEIEVKQLPHTEMRFGDMQREQVRSVSGTVNPNDIRFVSLRIPIESYPEQNMTQDEQDRLFEYQEHGKGGQRIDPAFIHRGYLFEPLPK